MINLVDHISSDKAVVSIRFFTTAFIANSFIIIFSVNDGNYISIN